MKIHEKQDAKMQKQCKSSKKIALELSENSITNRMEIPLRKKFMK